MRTEREVEIFKANAAVQVNGCKKCNGSLEKKCPCVGDWKFKVDAYEACIPKDFWAIGDEDIKYNRAAFDRFVLPYSRKLNKAHANGYGLFMSGSAGCGKSVFISYVLCKAIRRGKSAYYTTILQLDRDIKAGFDDKDAGRRLEWLLTSDFLAIDEMGKESAKATAFTKSQVERILKDRFDNGKPLLIGTTLPVAAFGGAYGEGVSSMVRGKMQAVRLEEGDIRLKLSKKMRSDMGYGEE